MMYSVQVMRGVAAVAVVIFHTHAILAQPEYGGQQIFASVATIGWIGVAFFFALSGFIILHAHARDIGHPRSVPRYLWRRFTRVYPLYWVLLSAFITAALLGIGHAEISWKPRHLLTAYSLLSVVDDPVLPLKVAWTLLFEIKFYLAFLVLLVSKRIGLILFALWSVAIVARSRFIPLSDWGNLAPDWGMLSIWNIHFLFGMTAYCVLLRAGPRAGIPLLVGGLILLLAACMTTDGMAIDVQRPGLMATMGGAFALIIVGGVLAERYTGWKPAAGLRLLGNASYAIYLIHSAVISLLAQFHFRVPFLRDLPPGIVFVAIAAAATGAGILGHIVIEQPLLAAFRRKRRSASSDIGHDPVTGDMRRTAAETPGT